MKQLAEIFRRQLGDAVDILGDGPNAFIDPNRRIVGTGLHGVAEDAGGAGEDEGARFADKGGF